MSSRGRTLVQEIYGWNNAESMRLFPDSSAERVCVYTRDAEHVLALLVNTDDVRDPYVEFGVFPTDAYLEDYAERYDLTIQWRRVPEGKEGIR